MLYKGSQLVNIEALEARDRPDKIVMMRELAATIERSGIDGIIEIGDAWFGKIVRDDQGFVIAPALLPDRMESLTVVAEDAYGNYKNLVSPYTRKGQRIEFSDEPIDMSETSFANNLQPIRDAWRRMGFTSTVRQP